ncbi:MAG TPA: pyrroline-5-carboxylate reductase [Armatimonadetes bacterium]|jgi:pyrroline-5-carboxylate reductase|nr:pyrroline-5-carboxylate reductase [Armatimonadota bacterium]
MADRPAYRIAVIGCGAMGSGIVTSLIAAGALSPAEVIGCDTDAARLEPLTGLGMAGTDDAVAAIEASEMVLLAVKPQVLDAVLDAVAGAVGGRLVISIAAGVPIARYEQALGADTPIIRVMPNVLCAVGEAASAYSPNAACTAEHVALAARLLDAMGTAVAVEEKLMDAVTGLSGSGPAFVALFAEALTDGGVAAGLPRAQAARLAAQTILGVGRWLKETGASPAQLKDMVTSPGGTTIAGIRALEEGGLRSATIEAVVAAAERSRGLGS